jgi:hypothetical protein
LGLGLGLGLGVGRGLGLGDVDDVGINLVYVQPAAPAYPPRGRWRQF